MERRTKINVGVLKELIKLGFTKYEIADFFNCSWNLVDKEILKNTLPKPVRKRNTPSKFSDEKLLKSLKKHNSNVSKVAEELGVSNVAIYNRLRVINKRTELKEKQEKWLSQTAESVEEN